jgi:hypothetical protein
MAHRAVFETKPGVKFLITPDFIQGLDLTFTTYQSEDNRELLYDSNPPFSRFLQHDGYIKPLDYLDYQTNTFIPSVTIITENVRQAQKQTIQASLLSIIHLLDLIEHKRLYWYKL